MEQGATLVSQLLKGGGISDLMGNDDLVTEALRDLLRDEVKRRMREELERNPEIMSELKESVRLYFEAKVYESYATLKFVKASAKLGVQLMPAEMRDKLGKEIGSLLEKEVAALLEKAV